jgi:hypothetical protein
VLVAAKAEGVPLMLTPDVRGIAPINLIHDEVVFVVADEYVDNAKRLVRDTMVNVWSGMKVPLEVDLEVVTRWSEKHTGPGVIPKAS